MIQLENNLLDTPKILSAEDDGTVFLGWVCPIQYREVVLCFPCFLNIWLMNKYCIYNFLTILQEDCALGHMESMLH